MEAPDPNRVILGKILGEIYRLQKQAEVPTGVGPERIYGLLNGFEDAINSELESIGFVSSAQLDQVEEVFRPYDQVEGKLETLNGFYDIEHELQRRGVDRSTAIHIFRYLKASSRYLDILEKMNSSHSPTECKTFDLYEWDE